MKHKVLVIVGPTAVGKTALSVELAKAFNGEIISGDSLQVYRSLDIGTAKATLKERQGIPHYLIDEREMTESYSVADFQKKGREHIEEITSRGKLPIVVGGTGLYIQSLLFDFQLGGGEVSLEEDSFREELEEYRQRYGNLQLWEKLRTIDEVGAARIHPNNVKRVIRGIEVMTKTGVSIAEQSQVDFKNLENALYDVVLVGLTTDRSLLYDRINQRVDQMMTENLLDEVKLVYDERECQAAQGIGYKEFFPYFDGEESLEACIDKVKRNSRRYAKRQLTWFKNRMNAQWWDLVQQPEGIEQLKKELKVWLNEEREW